VSDTDVKLSTRQIDQFDDDGYLLVRNVFSVEDVAAMRARVSAYLQQQREYPAQWVQLEAAAASRPQAEQGPGDYRKFSMITVVDPLFGEMVRRPGFAAMLQGCLGADVCAWGSGVFLKQARTGGRQPWHRDCHGYAGIAATIWSPLMDATVANGCIQIAPGSHKLEAANNGRFNAEQELSYQEGRFSLSSKHLEMSAGDVVIWNMKTLHSSAANESDASRWALAVHCVTTQAAIEMVKQHPDGGSPHAIIAGRHDPETAAQARCMHCDRQAFSSWPDTRPGYA
jgi:phytanoyl-CoA hydroxylase